MNAPARSVGMVIVPIEELETIVDRVVERRLEAWRQPEAEPLIFSCTRLCKRLGVSRATVFRWRREGMPAVRCGDDFRYELAPVLEWIRGRR